jgi:phosphohistidine phosphatase SixA
MNASYRATVAARPLRHLPLALVIFACLFAAARADGLQGAALVEALREGGFNIYLRHAATDWSQQDRIEQYGDWDSCDPGQVRQLSDAGRDTARAVGAAMRELGVPVGVVLASPYCRTLETARLLSLGEVEPSTDVMNLRAAHYFGGRDAVVARAQALLATPPPDATNRVIVAHGNVARNATPVYPGEAEAVIFRPDGRGGFAVAGRVLPDDWRALLARAGTWNAR